MKDLYVKLFGVALLAGAWIETESSWEPYHTTRVALLAGAWIETKKLRKWFKDVQVALLAGAWIETF